MSATNIEFYTTPAQDIVGEIDEARGDLFRATQCLTSDYPTGVEYEAALRAISDALQRIEYVGEMLKARVKRS